MKIKKIKRKIFYVSLVFVFFVVFLGAGYVGFNRWLNSSNDNKDIKAAFGGAFDKYSGTGDTEDGIILSACASAEIIKPADKSPIFYHGTPVDFSGRGNPVLYNSDGTPIDPPIQIIDHRWIAKGCRVYKCTTVMGRRICSGTKDAVEIGSTANLFYSFDVGNYSVYYRVRDSHDSIDGSVDFWSDCDSVTFDVGWKLRVSVSNPDAGRSVRAQTSDAWKQDPVSISMNVRKGEEADIRANGVGFDHWEGDIGNTNCSGSSGASRECTVKSMTKANGYDRNIKAVYSASSCLCDEDKADEICVGQKYNDSCGNPICDGKKDCSPTPGGSSGGDWKEIAP